MMAQLATAVDFLEGLGVDAENSKTLLDGLEEGRTIPQGVVQPRGDGALQLVGDDAESARSDTEGAKDVVGIVLTGEGGSFCSGFDLGVAAQSFLTPKTGADMSLLMHDTLSRFRRLPFISVAAVSGHAMGGGAELMTSCDLRVMDANAQIKFVQTKMGVVTGWQGGTRLTHLLGRSKALKILAGAPTLTANDCLHLGLADEIAGDGISALEKASKLISSWAGYPAAIRGMKRVVDGACTLNEEKSLRNEQEVVGSGADREGKMLAAATDSTAGDNNIDHHQRLQSMATSKIMREKDNISSLVVQPTAMRPVASSSGRFNHLIEVGDGVWEVPGTPLSLKPSLTPPPMSRLTPPPMSHLATAHLGGVRAPAAYQSSPMSTPSPPPSSPSPNLVRSRSNTPVTTHIAATTRSDSPTYGSHNTRQHYNGHRRVISVDEPATDSIVQTRTSSRPASPAHHYHINQDTDTRAEIISSYSTDMYSSSVQPQVIKSRPVNTRSTTPTPIPTLTPTPIPIPTLTPAPTPISIAVLKHVQQPMLTPSPVNLMSATSAVSPSSNIRGAGYGVSSPQTPGAGPGTPMIQARSKSLTPLLRSQVQPAASPSSSFAMTAEEPTPPLPPSQRPTEPSTQTANLTRKKSFSLFKSPSDPSFSVSTPPPPVPPLPSATSTTTTTTTTAATTSSSSSSSSSSSTSQLFEATLTNPSIYTLLESFVAMEHCTENIKFLESIADLQKTLNLHDPKAPAHVKGLERFMQHRGGTPPSQENEDSSHETVMAPETIVPTIMQIYNTFIASNAPLELNVPCTLKKSIQISLNLLPPPLPSTTHPAFLSRPYTPPIGRETSNEDLNSTLGRGQPVIPSRSSSRAGTPTPFPGSGRNSPTPFLQQHHHHHHQYSSSADSGFDTTFEHIEEDSDDANSGGEDGGAAGEIPLNVFDEAVDHVLGLLYTDTFSRFLMKKGKEVETLHYEMSAGDEGGAGRGSGERGRGREKGVAGKPTVTPGSDVDQLTGLISERDVSIQSAVECGMMLLHLLNLKKDETDGLKAQVEAMSANANDQGLLVVEKQVEIDALNQRLQTLKEQLRSAERNVLELNLECERKPTEIPTPPRSNVITDNTIRALKEELSVARETEATLKKALKKSRAKCVELQEQLDESKRELSLYKETNERLEPILRARQSDASLTKTQRMTAIRDAAKAQRSSKLALEQEESPEGEDPEEAPESEEPIMLALVRELTFANKKLETDLAEARQFLSEAQAEVANLRNLAEESAAYGSSPHLSGYEIDAKKTVFGELEDYVMSTSMQQFPILETSDGRCVTPLNDNTSQLSDARNARRHSRSRMTSAGSAEVSDLEDHEAVMDHSPERLHSADDSEHINRSPGNTVSLNRRLRRAFDLAELTRLSQNVIANINSDIQSLTSRFPLPDSSKRPSGNPYQEDALIIIHPIVLLVQTLLSDVALLRSTMNDLSLAYFERISQRSKVDLSNQAKSSESKPASPRTLSKSRSISDSLNVTLSLFGGYGAQSSPPAKKNTASTSYSNNLLSGSVAGTVSSWFTSSFKSMGVSSSATTNHSRETTNISGENGSKEIGEDTSHV
ncbi:enoyl CoA hydratase domain-containing protein 1 [Chytridiales sp. JEL 0842]|nr:enoyl CoA hydratase domain-containing protein 1 [Chytridiales sp. JEL 0842]